MKKMTRWLAAVLALTLLLSATMVASAGTVTPGDLNGDTKIDSGDARMVLQSAVGKLTLTAVQEEAADVNADGKKDTNDARMILQYAVGKITDFSGRTAEQTAKANEMIRLINEERTAAGLPALKVDLALAPVAQLRAKEITELFSHTRPNGEQCFTAFPQDRQYHGENIAGGYPTTAAVMEALMGSTSNRDNILSEKYTCVNVGAVYYNNTWYWAQVYASDKTELPDEDDTDVTAEVIRLVNEERAAAGLTALGTYEALTAAAQLRAEEIVTVFSHTRPNGEQCFTAFPSDYTAAGENIAYGYATPEAVVEAWMNSEGHRANILSEDFGNIGVGAVYQDGVWYWTQAFTN